MKKLISLFLSFIITISSVSSATALESFTSESSDLTEFTEDFCALLEGECDEITSNLSVHLSAGNDEGNAEDFENGNSDNTSTNVELTNRIIVKSENEVSSLNAVGHVCGYNDLHVLQFENTEDFNNAFEYYSSLSGVEFVQEDKYLTETSVSETAIQKPTANQSARFGYSSALSGLGSASSLPKIDVAVIDSGVEYDHGLLSDRVEPTGFNSIDSEGTCYDDRGHGTHVAGIIASNTLSNVTIKPYKVLDHTGQGTDMQVYLGIQAAIEDNVDVINLSLSRLGESNVLHEGVTNAYNAGITVVCAAGNDGCDLSQTFYSPACFDEVIAVMNCTDARRISDTSNYGTPCDVAAPGDGILSSYIGNTYRVMSGTSMATPFITAAVTYELSNNTSLSPDSIKTNLIEKSQPCYGSIPGKCVYPGESVLYSNCTVAPVFNYESTTFYGSLTLTIGCSSASAKILYRTSDMTSNLYYEYTKPIVITETTTVTAYCVQLGEIESSPVSVTLTHVSVDKGDFEIDDNGCILSYNGTSPTVTLPEFYDDKPVFAFSENAFKGNETITSVTLNSSVTEICDNAFSGCKNLSKINLQYASDVGSYAFSGCSALATFEAPYLDELGEGAFEGCSSIASLNLPKLKAVPASCFENATQLRTVQVASATSIGSRAFAGSSVLSVSCSAAKTIGDEAFINCPNLFSASISSVESIGKSAFENCPKFSSLNSDTLINIAERAFYGCSNLKTISVGNLEFIGREAFYGTAITKAEMPKVSDLGSNAFLNCADLTTVILDSIESIDLTSFTGCEKIQSFSFNSATELSMGELTMENDFPLITAFTASNLSSLPDGFFRNCKTLTNINLPGLVSVGTYSFSGTSIDAVDFQNLVTAGDYAFSEIETLKSVDLPALEAFNSTTFSGSESIETASFESLVSRDSLFPSKLQLLNSYTDLTLTEIVDNMFNGCVGLTSIKLPSAVSVGENAFWGTEIQTLNLPLVTSISDNAFSGALALKSVSLNGLTTINTDAFSGVEENITYLSFNSATELESTNEKTDNFSGFTKLGTIYCRNLKVIPKEAFKGLPTLKYVYADYTQEIAEGAFYNCTALYDIEMDNVLKISKDAFNGCTSLFSIDADKAIDVDFSAFENGAVQTISFDAFKEFPVDENGSIVFPNSEKLTAVHLNGLKSVPNNFLLNCPNLRIVSFNNAISIGEKAFYNTALTTYYLASVTDIGAYSFSGTSIVKADFPTAERIGEYAFADCLKIANLSLPLATELSEGAFKNNEILKNVSLSVVEKIGDYCFYNCDRIESISLPTVSDIGSYAFSDCAILTSVTFTGVKTIGTHAFENNPSLSSAGLPNSFTEIPEACFKNCPKLAFGNIRNDFTTVTKLGPEAFYGCKRLTEEAFSFDIIEYIGSNALNGVIFTASDSLEMCSLKTAEKDAFNGIDTSILYLESIETLNSIPSADYVVIGSKLESIDVAGNGATIISYDDSVAESYCNLNNIPFASFGEGTPAIVEVDDYFNLVDLLYYEAIGFNLKYTWYGCNNPDRSDAVVLEGLIGNEVNPIEYLLEEGREADYRYYFCVATSTENGRTVEIFSDLCLNLFNVIRARDKDKTKVDYVECFIYTLEAFNINSIENTLIVDGDISLTPSDIKGEAQCYGTGTVIDILYEGQVTDTYQLIMYSDVNGDGVVDVLDSFEIENVANGKGYFRDLFETAADNNSDGIINSIDFQNSVNQALSW